MGVFVVDNEIKWDYFETVLSIKKILIPSFIEWFFLFLSINLFFFFIFENTVSIMNILPSEAWLMFSFLLILMFIFRYGPTGTRMRGTVITIKEKNLVYKQVKQSLIKIGGILLIFLFGLQLIAENLRLNETLQGFIRALRLQFPFCFFPYFYYPDGMGLISAIGFSLVYSFGTIIVIIISDYENWQKKYYLDKSRIELILKNEFNEKLQLSIGGEALIKEMSVNESLQIPLRINTFKILKITSINLEIENFVGISNNNISYPLILEDFKQFSPNFKIKPIGSGYGRFRFSISSSKEDSAYYKLWMYKFFQINDPIITTDTYTILIVPPSPNIEIKYQYTITQRVVVSFTFTNFGDGLAKEINITNNLDKNFKVIQEIQTIKKLPPNSNSVKQDLVFEPLFDDKLELSFDISYTDDIGKKFTQKKAINIPIDFSVESRSMIESLNVSLAPKRSYYSTLYEQVNAKFKKQFKRQKLDSRVILKGLPLEILKYLINYQKMIKDNYWQTTKEFSIEKHFRDDLFNFLRQEKRFPEAIKKEVQFGRGHIDLLINGIPLELKLIKKMKQRNNLPREKDSKQIIQYCSQTNSDIGFLIYLDISPQGNEPEPLEINNFRLLVKPDDYASRDEFQPNSIIFIYIHGGEKAIPSDFKSS